MTVAKNTMVLSGLAAAVVVAGSSASAATSSVAPRVVLQPAIVRLAHRATVVVSGLPARAVQVRLAGGTYPDGTLLKWRSLHLTGGDWHGDLPEPALRGVYPVLLRIGPGSRPVSVNSFLRVFEPGTLTRPTFDDPVDVVRWWVRARHGRVVAVKPWPRPGFDQRDLRLHRLYVVAYQPSGSSRAQDRLGMFITAFRNGYGARWQLLEATAEP
jgi:hypothetical protein